MKPSAEFSTLIPQGDEVWLLYDGDCGMCNSIVQFILENERDHVIQFIALESELGKKLVREHLPGWSAPESVVLLNRKACYTDSDACAELAKHLKPPYSYLEGIKFTPSFLRDWAYQLVAKNRYRLGEKPKVCQRFPEEVMHRFLS